MQSLAFEQREVVRFISHVRKTGYCWNWIGSLTNGGYGLVSMGGKLRLAHRVSYTIFKGKIPEGLTIDHLCRNRRCVNPAHLEAVTMQENVLRGTSKAANNARKTLCQNGHPLVKDNLELSALVVGERRCLICWRNYRANRRAKGLE